jgi:hypothetical protein
MGNKKKRPAWEIQARAFGPSGLTEAIPPHRTRGAAGPNNREQGENQRPLRMATGVVVTTISGASATLLCGSDHEINM